MTIDGALAAALVDFRSGMVSWPRPARAMNLDLAAAGNTQVVRAKLQTMEALGLRKGIEDILITLTDQYHLIRLADRQRRAVPLPGAGQEQEQPRPGPPTS